MPEKTTGRSDVIVGFILLGVAILFFALSFSLPVRRAGLSPTTFPRFVTIVMFLLSSILIGQGARRIQSQRADIGSGAHRAAGVDTSPEAPGIWRQKKIFAVRFVLLSLLGIGYTQVIGKLGFVVSTPLMIAGTMILFDERKWYRILLVAGISTAILYSLFRLFFRVPLPRFDLW